MSSQSLYLFFIASLMLNLTPGNDMIYVSSRSLSQGTRAGLVSAAGIFLGCLVHIVAAIVGLSTLILKFSLLYDIIKYAGAAYLIYLGIKTVFSKSDFDKNTKQFPPTDSRTLLKEGIITSALNPKVALFFLSFLPQFVDPASVNFKWHLLTLGLWFDLQGTLVLIIVALLLGRTTNLLRQYPKFWMVQEKVTGAILIALGLKIAFSSRK